MYAPPQMSDSWLGIWKLAANRRLKQTIRHHCDLGKGEHLLRKPNNRWRILYAAKINEEQRRLLATLEDQGMWKFTKNVFAKLRASSYVIKDDLEDTEKLSLILLLEFFKK